MAGNTPTSRQTRASRSSRDPGWRLLDRHGRRPQALARPGRTLAAASALALPLAMLMPAMAAQAAPVRQGFVVTADDLSYILSQIKVAEHHVQFQKNPPAGHVLTGPCDGLIGTGPAQFSGPLIAGGLRTVDGSCNNLQPGQDAYGAADRAFPRLSTPAFRPAESSTLFGPDSGPTSYAQHSGNVFDTQPRLISNLIVDQTSTNPAAVAAAAHSVRSQSTGGLVPCTTDPAPDGTGGIPAGCVPSHQTLFIPNVTTDVGLSPPYNSLFTIFGQFFDHGLDKITTGGSGTVFVPLRADDPLIAGPDHVVGTPDDLPPSMRFMVLTRGTELPGPDKVLGTADDIHESVNTDSPYVDQSQSYSSHPSHQVFLREYALDASNRPQATGRLLGHADGSMATWGDVKKQAAEKLGLKLVDTDVNNIPMIAADAYGNLIPGPHGLAQYVTASGLVEGNLASPVLVPANALHIDTAFLNDIAHSAVPTGVPDPDTTAGSSLTPANCGTGPSPCYDNELLDLHVIAGDGRANENIGLTAIHTIFEHEHNRLTGYLQNVLDDPVNSALRADFNAVSASTFTVGERMFQAARFVNEMEYQHIVFEEFARKVQPALNPFDPFANTNTDPAIKAEFAHAVYRFGHSMLDETIPRTDVNGVHHDIPLLNGFLNPQAFSDVTPADLTSAGGDMGTAAAGAIVMGLSDQVGNELDEFVSDTLRNNLLGLPLDLATLNITRARSEGIPPLNQFRREVFARTGDAQLTPYTSWVDFGQHLKHPESLVNFVAAYGTHPSITAATTVAAKRAAARAIVSPLPTDVPPADAGEFMQSLGAWADDASGSRTGLDQVDMWVGGLAESTQVFGGLLGSTFNYVFELQLTQLQDDDRLYYLNRLPGMNLLGQIEGNSFAELVERNTTAHTLKADAFATADCKFQVGNLVSPATSGANLGIGSVQDDPTSQCNENALLIKVGDQIRYRATNSVDKPGINGQSVYDGSSSADSIGGGSDNDTIIGNAGDDKIEGFGGSDNLIGGDGNDTLTDSGGDDILRGGPGNDAVDGGPGNDLLFGGDGSDLLVGGGGTNTHHGGPGNDFILAGEGSDTVSGDSGDDWMQGGNGLDVLQGDSGSPFLNDLNNPGNDVLIGGNGDDNNVMEGGDDIALSGPGIDKNSGGSGWDWTIAQGDPQPMDADLSLQVGGVALGLNAVRDRYTEVEALSGSSLDDTLRGDDVVPTAVVGGGGIIGCDALDANGVARVQGLDALVPSSLRTLPSVPIVAASATLHCPLVGNVWGAGNILLGGAGSDTIEGRGGDDIIDGDRYLQVRLSIRTNPADPATEIGTTDLLEHTAAAGSFGPGTAGMTLQQAVFAHKVDPANIVTVREILSDSSGTDTAVFSGPMSNYSIAPAGDTVVVSQVGKNTATQKVSDGTDTLRNIERLQFSDQTVTLAVPATPANIAATAGELSANVTWSAASGTLPTTSFEVVTMPASGPATTSVGIPGTATSFTVTGLTPGMSYTFAVLAVNDLGASSLSAASNAVVPTAPLIPPGAPTTVAATAGMMEATVTWVAPAPNGGPPVTSYEIVSSPATVANLTGIPATATSAVVTGLTAGTSYTFRVRAVSDDGPGLYSSASNAIVPKPLPLPTKPTSSSRWPATPQRS